MNISEIGRKPLNKNLQYMTMIPLNDWDVEYVKQNLKKPLKENEVIMRYTTQKMMNKFKPLIKINVKSKLIYFLVNSDNDEILFEKKGEKVDYIYEKTN
jgi:hypothetical protein